MPDGQQNRFSSIVLQIVQSDEFRKREAAHPAPVAPAVTTASVEKTSLQGGGQ
jgi:hypothetical protein